MTAIALAPIASPSITGWQITQDTALDVEAALAEIAPLGWHGDVNDYQQPNSDNLVWTVTLTRSGFPTLVAVEDDWILFDGTNVSICTPTQILAYTAEIPVVWASTTTAPNATAQSGLQALITSPLPTSPNGPWTWSCQLTNVTTGAITTETVSSPVITNGQLMFTATGLIDTDEYTAAITCTTQYDGVLATSLPTALFTAAA